MRPLALAIGLALAAFAGAGTATADPKRPVPDYDGRGNPDARPRNVLRWIPRILLAPIYLINEYVLRRPLAAFVTHAERNHWAQDVEGLFTFGPDGKDLIVPTALFDFGLLPSVGVYFAADDAIVTGDQIRLHAATWGPKWLHFTAADRFFYDEKKAYVEARFEFKRSEDNLFFGVGPDTINPTRARYGLQRIEGSLDYRRRLEGESLLSLSSGVHGISYVDGSCCLDPAIDTRIAAGQIPPPPGYGTSYLALFEHADLILDSRDPRPAPGTGVYARVHGTASFDVSNARSWIDYGAVVGGSVDLTGHNRVLKLQGAVDFVDPLQGGVVPFNELASPATTFMPGFITGYMTDRSFATAQLGYTWPIWIAFDGQARIAAGNAFGNHLDNFSLDKLRLSADVGLTTSTVRDQGFEILAGVGTETFEQGGRITTVRISFGSRQGF